MKIDAFAGLEAVIRHGTLSAAATEMHLTAGALSVQMKQLEAYFGQPLFDRSGQVMRPTALAVEASKVMGDARFKLEALRTVSHLGAKGTLTLGVFESMLPALLPPMLTFVNEKHPGLELQLISGRTVTLTAAVKAGELDAALVAQPEDGGSTRLVWVPMERRELVLVAPPTSAEATPGDLFARYEWIRYDRKTVSGGLAKRWVEAANLPGRVSREYDSAAAILSMVNAGFGISILEISEPGILHAYPVRVIRLGQGAPSYQLAMIVRKADAEKRALAALQNALRYALEQARYRRQISMLAAANEL